MDGQTSGPSVDIRRYYESRMPADSDSVVSNHEHLRAPMYEPKPKSPGQDGFNPCAFASCLCHGTCNLRIGCYVIGGILLGSNVIFILYTYAVKNFYSRHNLNSKALTDSEQIYDYLHKHYPDETVDWIFVMILGIIPGILLLIASARLEKITCILYIIVTTLGSLGLFVNGILVSSAVISKVPTTLLRDPEAKLSAHVLAWLFIIVREVFYAYCICCGVGLYIQIKKGERKRLDQEQLNRSFDAAPTQQGQMLVTQTERSVHKVRFNV